MGEEKGVAAGLGFWMGQARERQPTDRPTDLAGKGPWDRHAHDENQGTDRANVEELAVLASAIGHVHEQRARHGPDPRPARRTTDVCPDFPAAS